MISFKLTWNGQDRGENPRKMFFFDLESIPPSFISSNFSKLISKARKNIKIYNKQVQWMITQFQEKRD